MAVFYRIQNVNINRDAMLKDVASLSACGGLLVVRGQPVRPRRINRVSSQHKWLKLSAVSAETECMRLQRIAPQIIHRPQQLQLCSGLLCHII